MWLFRTISWPHFSRHAARSALTLVGIVIGVAAMVATVSVTETSLRSFRRMLEVTAGSADLQISNGSAGVPLALADQVAEVPGVASTAPLIEGFVHIAGGAGEMLAVFGFDLLSADGYEAQLPRTAVHIPDTLTFANQRDSVAITRALADARGYKLESVLPVMTPRGPRDLVVRGLVDTIGPATLFGGIVGLMDVSAAQELLATDDRVTRIDLQVAPGYSVADVRDAVSFSVRGRARVDERALQGARADQLLFSLRVILTLAGMIAAVVAFFIIYHTVTVSILQRRHEIALLTALGVSRKQMLGWLGIEAAILGSVAAVAGLLVGHLMARAALSTFGAVSSAWVRIPVEPMPLSLSMIVVAAAAGLIPTAFATVLPALTVIWQPVMRFLHPTSQSATAPRGRRIWRPVALGSVGLLAVVLLVAFAPQGLSYGPLVAYIFGVNCMALVSFALLSPAAALALGLTTRRAANHARGLSALIAGGAMVRNPAGSVPVVAAIVVGLGWILADTSLIVSLKSAWLRWLDNHYQSDLMVSAGGMSISLLTYPPIAEELAQGIRTVPGVREVQGVRAVEMTYDGRPFVVQALDPSQTGLPLVDGDWPSRAPAFDAGQGVLLTENFAYRTGLRIGDRMSLPARDGPVSLPVLGTYVDFQGNGDLGGIAIARSRYRALWRDPLLSRVRVWIAPGADLAAVRNDIQQRFGATYGVHAVTFAQARAGVVELVDGVFSINYAVVLIALTVSFIGVTNFLLAAVLDRRAELNTLNAIGVGAGQIARSVILEGSLLGVIGVLIGAAAGYVVARIIVLYSVPMVNGWQFPLDFPKQTTILLCVSGVLLAAAAGVLPARLATRRRASAEPLIE